MEFEKEFIREEINILIEAVDAWVEKGFDGLMIGSLLGAVLCGKDASEDTKRKMEEDREKDRVKYETAKALKKDQAIMLKAKLLKIRDSQEASSVLNV